MPETRWTTINRDVPNDAIPPGRMFAQAMPHPQPYPQINATVVSNPPVREQPPSSGNWGPPPPAYNTSIISSMAYNGRVAPPTIVTVPSAPDGAGPFYEPPGQYVDGQILQGNGWSYIAPADNTTINFVGGGLRPCDWPQGNCSLRFNFSRHKAPCNMTVRELMKRLGCPDGDTVGLTEVREVGSGSWIALDSFTQGGESSKQTLAQVGWTKERDENNGVWLVVKR